MSRAFVYASLVTGSFFVVQRAAGGTALYFAFIEGCAAAVALMLLAALAQRLHAGDRLHSLQLPGGAGAEFEPTGAVDKVRGASDTALAALTDRVDDIAAVQQRLIVRLTAAEKSIRDNLYDQ